MKRIIAMLAVAGMVFALAPAAQAVDLSWTDSIEGPYRIVFVTTANPAADATVTMPELNAFVTGLAQAPGAVDDGGALGTTWSVVGATSTVNVFDNTDTEPGVDTDTPIYLVDGTLFASNLVAFWSGVAPSFPKTPPGDQEWVLHVNEQGGIGGGNGTWAHTGLEAGPVTSVNALDSPLISHGGLDDGYNPWYGNGDTWAVGIDHGALFAISDVIGTDFTKSVSETAVNLDLGLTNLTYTIEILNTTTTALGGIVVTDALPAEVSFVSSIPPASMTNNNDYIFDMGNLEAGSNVVIQIVVTVTSTVPGVITNVAMFSTTNTNVVISGTMDTAETLLYRSADLDITKALSSVRSNLNYTITVTNRGAGIAEDVMVFDSLPANTIFDSSTPAPAGVSGSDYTFNLGTLAPGVASSIVFSLVYTSALPATVTNTASTTTTSTETSSTNNSFTLISLIGQGVELALSKTVNPTNLLSGATNLTYTITVNNIGTTSAVSVVVTDSLPAGVTFLMAVPAASQTNGNELTFDLGSIAFGGGTSIVIDAVYTAGLVGITLTNWATVYTPTQELSLINNRDSATTVILDPLVDTDGDGMPDCAEIIAGTNPSDPTSYLWVQIERTANQSVRQLTFPSVVTRTYHIQSSTNFNTGPWVNVQTNIPGIDALIDTFRTNLLDKTYYRVGVE